ncbi:MAG: preprotein translocase subunit YajC [Parachlamydiaceae bacterium]|nr:preprotein translocase subunit YajC [Parachlamydiaceae bacterium]
MTKFFYSFLSFQAFFLSSNLFAQEGDVPTPPRDQGFMQTLIMIGMALVFFYLILWRPEQKRRKVMEEQRGSMKKGDRVTAMGIVGTVDKIQEHTVIVRMVDGSKIEFLKAAISEVAPNTETVAKTEE